MKNRDISKIAGSAATHVPIERIYSAIIEQLYQAAAPGIIANASLGIILVWTLWGNVPQFIALIWLGVNLVVNLLRLLLSLYVLKLELINEQSWKRWATTHMVAIGITSSVWDLQPYCSILKGQLNFRYFLH